MVFLQCVLQENEELSLHSDTEEFLFPQWNLSLTCSSTALPPSGTTLWLSRLAAPLSGCTSSALLELGSLLLDPTVFRTRSVTLFCSVVGLKD